MLTFTEVKDIINNPNYLKQREKAIKKMDINTIDAPLTELIKDFIKLPYCFTLQSCYGHFLHSNQNDPNNVCLLQFSDNITTVEYRIGYIALCIQESEIGKILINDLISIEAIDPEFIQFGCAEWFWKCQVNSFALQIEPRRYMTKDRVNIDYHEALHIEKIKNMVFDELKEVIHKKAEIEA